MTPSARHAVPPGPAAGPALRVTCWGTRGSIPSPGPDTIRYGGNTSCVEVRAGGRPYILDAGTGIRSLSHRLAVGAGPLEAEIFVSHFHWDHIQGFPFFAQLYEPASRVRVHGPRQGEVEIESVFAGQMGPIYFPVPLEALEARLEFAHVDGTPWSDGTVEVASYLVRHARCTYGYRLSAGGASVAYVPDNELGDEGERGSRWYAGLVDFLSGADLLLHDAMFTDAEYARFRGWGHSTFAQATRLAEDAGVRRLGLFHHAPDRSDAQLDAIVADLRESLARRRSPLELHAATEGEELALSPEAVSVPGGAS